MSFFHSFIQIIYKSKLKTMFDQIKQLKHQVVHFYEHFDFYPLKRLCQLRYVLNTTFSVVGIGILDKNWKVNLLTVFKLIVTFIFVIFCMYTIWYYLNQSVLVLQVFCCQGVFLPVWLLIPILLRTAIYLYIYFSLEYNKAAYCNKMSSWIVFVR